MLRWLLAASHLLAFGIGLGAIWSRAANLKSADNPGSLKRALVADSWWGIAALLWIATGLPRLFMSTEKATSYYLSNHVFWLKMALFLAIFLLELGPMVTLLKWRRVLAKGRTPDTNLGPRFAVISQIQVVLVLAMLLAATAMARGYGSAP
jgi:putative membrane protein